MRPTSCWTRRGFAACSRYIKVGYEVKRLNSARTAASASSAWNQTRVIVVQVVVGLGPVVQERGQAPQVAVAVAHLFQPRYAAAPRARA